ncbi:MAG: hypothetical protein FJ144_23160 [Deltaproteobacteria bacterium]|nr:hypothetical protein [Deltaproteobacteria bacterium]
MQTPRADPPRPESSAPGRAERVALALAAVQTALFVLYFARSLHPIPRWDFYDWVTGYLDASSVSHYLWRLHNEHRLVVNKLLVIADVELLGGRLWPLSCAGLASLVGWAAIVLRAILRDEEAPRGLRFCIAGGMLFVLFPTYSLDDYTYPTNLQLTFVTFFFVVAIACLLRAGSSNGWLAASLATAVAASLSSANGLLAWPILLVLAWRLAERRMVLLGVAVAGVATIALYLVGYAAPGHASGYMSSATDLLRFLSYLVAYFGMPWVSVEALRPLGLAIGLTTLLLATITVVRLGLGRRILERREALALGLLLFAGGTGLLTSFGRMNVGPHPAHRYTIFAIVAQAGLLLAAMTPLRRLWAADRAKRRISILTLAPMPLLLVQQVWVGEFAVDRAVWFAKLEHALLAGDRRPEITQPIYPDRQRLEYHLSRLAERRIYLYRLDPPGSEGR